MSKMEKMMLFKLIKTERDYNEDDENEKENKYINNKKNYRLLEICLENQ